MIQRVATESEILHTLVVTPGIKMGMCEAMDPSQSRDSSFRWADTTKELVTVRGTRASTYNSETYIPQVVFFCLHSDMDESLNPL